MFGKWAYGFWQCKNRYKSQDEILGVAHKYRELHIPSTTLCRTGSGGIAKVNSSSIRIIPTPRA